MRKIVILFAVVVILVVALAPASAFAAGNGNGPCWGQATAVFARMGEQGDHASSFSTPREGLANLARLLFGPDGTMADLGAFVAAELGLSIEACM